MSADQMVLELGTEDTEVRDAFADGFMYVLVSRPERSAGHRDSMVCGGNAADASGMVRWVHVMSKPAGGEVRGYALVGDELRLRLPAHPESWPEVDAEVCKRLECARVVTRTERECAESQTHSGHEVGP
ncbi:hypothetical protein [Myxococcus sp. AS-1-15]|uniref:hypothetical protein n=1 Tax=Myxococcus sp. AS-1-15 TaxID=2874600 RepID=UPI001CC188F0|nr:hypothetical protein [Myxococcus sp. AS-1-15]MBZ4398657.1 hypothetical protein [Myxococcus sp. AS-1-15]